MEEGGLLEEFLSVCDQVAAVNKLSLDWTTGMDY